MNKRFKRAFTLTAVLLAVSTIVANANLNYSIPYFTGPDAGAADGESGIYSGINGATWQAMVVLGATFDALLPLTWDAGNIEWNLSGFRQERYEAGPNLYTQSDQRDVAIVFTVPFDGTLSITGTLQFDGAGLNSLDAGEEVKIRAEVWKFAAGSTGAGLILANLFYNASLGNEDPAWDLGSGSELQGIPVAAGERIAINARKVGVAGNMRADLSGITISAPDGLEPIIVTPVAADDAVLIAFDSQEGINYVAQYTTDLFSGPWVELPSVLVGTGSTLFFYDDAGVDALRSYRLIEATP